MAMRQHSLTGAGRVTGSVTVFLALSLSASRLFTETALESARAFLLRAQAQTALESALDSLFAGYDTELFDRYGLLFLNRGRTVKNRSVEAIVEDAMGAELNPPGGGTPAAGNLLREHVAEVAVTEMRDPVYYGQGEYYARNVLDYMKYRAVARKVQEITDAEQISELGEEARRQNEASRGSSSQAAKEAEEQMRRLEQEEGKEDSRSRTEEEVNRSLIGKVNELRKSGILNLTVPSVGAISRAAISYADYPSLHYGDSGHASLSFLKESSMNLLMADYALEHFQNYTSGGGSGTLRYEQEYILSGKASDYDNLSGCIDRLLFLREGMNILTIVSEPDLCAAASSFAAGLVGWTGIGALTAVTEGAVIASWAFGESILDVRSLLAGEKIPLRKIRAEWRTDLDSIGELLAGENRSTACQEHGMTYGDYVCMLMLKVPRRQKQFRMMDLTEFSMRAVDGGFRMHNCIYGLSVSVTVTAAPLFSGIGGTGGYQFTVRGSRMY